ncbi:hypothetical protein [Flaviflagellibacter deserti]|uniref:Uncharacterized protein n=1 Tax=Flaviflagellibacter deserti TaxID=2267266 RepID=A0ABV9Z151_9HYPH
MATKIQGQRAGPPAGSWRKLNEGMPVEVAGLRSRLREVQSFIQEAKAAGEDRFGVLARQEVESSRYRKSFAIAVDGWWVSKGLLGGQKRHQVQLGYLPEWIAHQCQRPHVAPPEPVVFVELDTALSDEGFVDVDVLVRVNQALARPTETSAARIAKTARQQCMPGLKVLARVAMAKGYDDEVALFARMADYVNTRSSRLGLHPELDVVGQIVEAAVGLAPTDEAVLAATRLIAEDDQGLEELFRFALDLSRAGGKESEAAIAVLKRVLEMARQCRARSS